MDELVVDASALVLISVGSPDVVGVVADHLRARVHAPAHIDAEVGQALRGLERADRLSPALAGAALIQLGELVDVRHPYQPLLAAKAWSLRHNVTYYDALYVALAELLEAPLVTADARLARAPHLPCEVQLVG